MKLYERLTMLAEAMPPGGQITIPRADLLEWIAEDRQSSEPEPVTPLTFKPDYSTAEVAAMFGRRNANTVTGWIRSGQIKAYKLNGRDYRITAQAIEDFQELHRKGKPAPRVDEVSLTGWRRLRAS